MKTTHCILLLLALAAVPATAAPGLDIPRLDGIAIDGKGGDWGQGGYRLDVLESMSGNGAAAAGQRVWARLGWDSRGLLMLVHIWDDTWMENPRGDRLYEGDSIEVFLGVAGGLCQWVISPGMDAAQPAVRQQFFDKRSEPARGRPAQAQVVRTRSGGECTVEILLPWSATGVEPAESKTTLSLHFWVNDRDGHVEDIRRVWMPATICRLARQPSPAREFIHWSGFDARTMLTTLELRGGAAAVGKEAQLVQGGKVVSRATLAADASGYACATLLMPERGAGAEAAELTAQVAGKEVARVALQDNARARAEQFLFAPMAATPAAEFDGEALPTLDFADAAMVARAIGSYTLKTTYYDSRYEIVTRAAKPGRYGAVVEVMTPQGRLCRRFASLVRRGGPATEDQRQWWVEFKRRFYGWDKRWPKPFVCPRPNPGPPAPVVGEGSAAEAGMTAGAAAAIDAVLTQWAADSDEPFTAAVVRHGVIVLSKAYGVREGKAISRDTPSFMASMTKCLSATLMLTVVDQGLVDLDAPVAEYLPPFQAARMNKPLTLRHLYTHTSGISGWHWGAGEHDLEERLAAYMPHVRVGEAFLYNGTGFDLGSKVLEAASGEALPALAQGHLLGPLGCRNTTMPDGGGSAFSTADDLVRIGQMLLNKGAYGRMRFMSERTFEQLLPVRLTKVLGPDAGQVYGLGTMWFDYEGWGKGAFAHGAKSETVLRVVPEHDLVVAIARSRRGTNFETYYPRFIQAVLSGIDPRSAR
ncbi:MAG: serine hydrolase [Planctomycetaceae bacterium]|nr:serine hydrolase [Planctomycetaceae bacterium]